MTITTTSAIRPLLEPTHPENRLDASSPGFVVPAGSSLAQSVSALAQARDVAKLTDARAILALQEEVGWSAADADAAAEREARRRGRDILDALAEVQKGLLAGVSLQVGLSHLSALTEMPLTASDPDLARVIGAIRLRAKLEVLRLTSLPKA